VCPLGKNFFIIEPPLSLANMLIPPLFGVFLVFKVWLLSSTSLNSDEPISLMILGAADYSYESKICE